MTPSSCSPMWRAWSRISGGPGRPLTRRAHRNTIDALRAGGGGVPSATLRNSDMKNTCQNCHGLCARDPRLPRAFRLALFLLMVCASVARSQAVLTGFVRADSTLRPLRDVEVLAASKSARTDASGKFTLRDLP